MTTPSNLLLALRGVDIRFAAGDGEVQVASDVSFTIGKGERLALVGESGCGKTVTSLAIMGLLPGGLARAVGDIQFDNRNLLTLPERDMAEIRGRRIGMIFQEPMRALDPVFTVGEQIAETLRRHFKCSRGEARTRTIEVLADVGIPAPGQRYAAYPHELSGGMRQRIMIAMALVCEPELLIADEPTTALDVTVQGQILDLLVTQCARLGASLLLITHDLGVVAATCERMITMYAGQVVEDGPVEAALRRPLHPYTSGLLRSIPRLSPRKSRLPIIPGRVPSPTAMPQGCRFEPRCGHAEPGCERPQILAEAAGRRVRCVRAGELSLPSAVA